MPGPGSRISICGAAALTADVEIDVGHARRFYNIASVIPAIVLAAGRSSRMGRAEGDSAARRRATRSSRASCARSSTRVSTMSSSSWDMMRRRSSRAFPRAACRARFVVNPDYDRGQLSSLVAGLAVVDRPGVAAALVTLVDVPLVSRGHRARGDRLLSPDARAGRAAHLRHAPRPSAAHRSLAVRRAARCRSRRRREADRARARVAAGDIADRRRGRVYGYRYRRGLPKVGQRLVIGPPAARAVASRVRVDLGRSRIPRRRSSDASQAQRSVRR